MSTMHGPNYLAISAKARQELLSAIQEAMNMEFSNPAERRYVTQISASPLSISLSLTLYSYCDLSLGCVACVFVFMVVWPWVWVSLFLWVCGHVCM